MHVGPTCAACGEVISTGSRQIHHDGKVLHEWCMRQLSRAVEQWEADAVVDPAPQRPRAWRLALALWLLAGLGATIAALVLSRLLGAL